MVYKLYLGFPYEVIDAELAPGLPEGAWLAPMSEFWDACQRWVEARGGKWTASFGGVWRNEFNKDTYLAG